MKIQLYNRAQAKAYTIPVGSGSTYTWKKQEEEYITVNFSSESVLALKKGFYTNIESLGRFEVVDLPTPTKASKDIGYEYELRLDRPWYKFKNRIIFFRRGSVNGMEAKWSLTDTLQAHAGILTDNLANIGYTYAGKEYLVYIHDDVEKRNEAKLIAYDSTTLLSALDKIAESFETEWWITENTIHFGRCEQGQTITLEQGKELNGLSRSEDIEEHGTRLYAFGSSRNLNQNYRRKLKNPFTIDGFHRLYGTKVRFTTNKPKNFFSEKRRIKITSNSKYEEQTFTFKVVSGSYTNPAAGQTVSWNNPVFEIEVGSMVDAIGFQNGTGVQFIIGDETGGQTDDSKTTMVKVERDSYPIFSFKDLQLQKKAITKNSTITLADNTTTGIEFIGIASDGTNNVNDGRDCYALTDKNKKLTGSSQQVTLAHLAMAYINKLYTEPIDGQSEVAIQGVSDTILQLPIGTPYIDSDPNLAPEDITDIVKTYEDIYPRALLTITEVTEIPAKTTDTDTGNVTYWTAYRFKAKLQDGSPFVFDSIYETQEENKPLSIHFESGTLNGMDFEVHFNPDADTDDNQLFEITRNDTYTLELPNETMKPAVGDTLYMYNMDITFIDDELVEAAEMELKAEAEKDMKKMKVDIGTYTGTKNPVLFGQKGIELTYGSKVKLVAPEYFDKEDHATESRIIGWELDLEDLTQGELTIGESKTGSRSDTLAETVSQIVYKNEQIQNQQELQLSKIRNLIDTIVGKRFLSKLVDDTAEGIITFLQGIKLGKGGEYSIEGNGKASLREVFANAIKAAKTISVGNNFYFDADGEFKFDKEGNILAHSISSDGASEENGKGFTILQKDPLTNTYKLCIDEVIAYTVATVGKLFVNGNSRFGGELSSKQFISGFLGGLGWGIYNTPVTNAAGVQENKWTGEFDNVIVRGSLRVFEMIISQLLGENDNRIFTGMMEVDHYDAESGRVYLNTQDGKLYNPFRRNDIIMVQQFNGMPNSSNDYYVTKNYELLITDAGCGSLEDGDKRLDWVTFTNFTSSMEGATAESLIKKKDTFVRVDNLSDSQRKGIIQLMTVGANTPYMDIIYGLKTDPNNALKGRLGNLKGIVHPILGELSGFGEFLNNLYAVGDFIIQRTGESVDSKLQVLENMFSSRFSQTSYELTNSDNYLENGQFLEQVRDDEDTIISCWAVDTTDESMFWADALGNPFMVNGLLSVSGNRKVSIDKMDGRQVLRLQNCGVKQLNAHIRQPGTHKEYQQPSGSTGDNGLKKPATGSTDVQDRLYISIRIFAKTAGTLTVGFEGCSSVSGKSNTLTAQNVAVPYSGDWTNIPLEGVWNGTGNFVLRYTGDCYIAIASITDKPLSEFSKSVSTQIKQTATNIQLLGENIDSVNGTTTQLGIDLDAEKKSIRLYVDETDKANRTFTTAGIEASVGKVQAWVKNLDYATNTTVTSKVEILSGRITSTVNKVSANSTSITNIQQDIDTITQTVGQAATKEQLKENVATLNRAIDSARSHADDVGTGIRNDYASTITLVKQSSSSWSVAAGGFDANGKLKSSAGAVLNTDFAGLFVSQVNEKGLVNKGQMNIAISNGISTATIQADQINLTGHTMAFTGNQITIDTSNFKLDGSGNVEMSGKVVAMSGQIAGMKISGLGLTNAGFDNDAYIILRNDKLNTFAGIGYHVAAYESAVNAVAHFSNGETKDSGEKNYAMVVNAYGADDNIAIGISGGYIEGLRVKTGMLTAGGASSNSPVKISKGIHSIMIAGAGYYQLPAMEKNDDGYVLFLKNEYNGSINIVTSSGINRKGEKKDTFILFNRGDKTTNLTVDSRGDAMVFVYHRDVVQEGYNFRGGCWVQYKCPRDW